MKIVIQEDVIDFLNQLITTLHKKEYFGFKDAAIEYVMKIFEFIENDLNKIPHKVSPKKLKKFGEFYVFYNSSQRTTWYIFFKKTDSRIIISYINNNHNENANFL